METVEFNAADGSFEASASCHVVVVYEDVSAQKLALDISDHLRARFGEDLEFEFGWWNFKFLGDAEMAQAARREAQSADIVLFSLHHESELPAAVTRWIENWTPERLGQTGALAVMTEPWLAADRRPARPEVEDYLAGVARRAEMDFLVLAGAPQNPPPAGFQIGAVPVSKPVEAQWHPNPSSHWGINE